jgi:adenylate cyclase
VAGPGIVRTIRRRSRRLRAGLLAAVAVVALVVVGLLLATNALHRVELLSVDSRFELRGDRGTPAEVIVVGMDDRTFNTLDVSWPFPRSLHADVIDEVRKAGAKVIAYDVQFTEPSPPGLEEEDAALLAAVERARGRIVLATTEVSPRGRTKVLGSDRVRRSVGARVGNAVTPSDPNGVVRRIHERYDRLDTFAFAAAEMARGARPGPLPEEGAWIDFHGPPGTLDSVSFGAVQQGNVDPERFRDRVVVVGAVAPSLQDVAATSASRDEVMSGPEIQAEAITTILDGAPLRDLPGWASALLALVMAVTAPLLALRMGARWLFITALGAAAAYLALAQGLFEWGTTIIPVAIPLTGLALGTVGSLGALLVVEALERQRVRDVFSHFVPSAVVDDVLERAGGELRLGGISRECTALFSDLRGFTSFSEGKEPSQVIDILNDYLSEMTDAILDHGGTLVSFMGDGIYALFGAPLDQPDHRDRAVETARVMLERLDAFNARMGEQGLDKPFRMGIGLNTGTVMCGNVGSARRLEYTAIGDTINTASRIEGMTKETGHPVHIAEATVEGVQRCGGFVKIAELPVRGRKEPITLYGLKELAPPVAGSEEEGAAAAAGNGHARVQV